jgi:sec-independent protein translocase protein TatC
VPILQFILGFLGIITGKKMLKAWKYVLIITTILAAVITPSTDPITQILMASALFLLYLGGAGIVVLVQN